MARRSKGDNPNFVFRRQWKGLFQRIISREGYEGLGKLIIAIYEELDNEDVTPELSPYLLASLDNFVSDIQVEHSDYKARCEQNRENKQKYWEELKAKEHKECTNVYERIPSYTNDTKYTNTSTSNNTSTSTSASTSTSTSTRNNTSKKENTKRKKSDVWRTSEEAGLL